MKGAQSEDSSERPQICSVEPGNSVQHEMASKRPLDSMDSLDDGMAPKSKMRKVSVELSNGVVDTTNRTRQDTTLQSSPQENTVVHEKSAALLHKEQNSEVCTGDSDREGPSLDNALHKGSEKDSNSNELTPLMETQAQRSPPTDSSRGEKNAIVSSETTSSGNAVAHSNSIVSGLLRLQSTAALFCL